MRFDNNTYLWQVQYMAHDIWTQTDGNTVHTTPVDLNPSMKKSQMVISIKKYLTDWQN